MYILLPLLFRRVSSCNLSFLVGVNGNKMIMISEPSSAHSCIHHAWLIAVERLWRIKIPIIGGPLMIKDRHITSHHQCK